MKLIVAVDEQWGIGKNGDLLLSIPDDMRFFRETTRNAVLVMGYNTLLSFPNSKPLPGRMNLVLADIEGLTVSGTVVCNSMEQLFGMIKDMNPDDIFVIGGGYTYRQLLPYCDTAYITKMQFVGEADTFIPNLDELSEWQVAEESEIREHEGVKYSFVTYHNACPEPVGFTGVNADMPRYFVKKPPLTFEIADTEDAAYREELHDLLHSYFRPLEQGVNSADIAAYLESESIFENYLRERHAIALSADITAFTERYASLPETHTVTVTREDIAILDRFTGGELSAEQTVQQIEQK